MEDGSVTWGMATVGLRVGEFGVEVFLTAYHHVRFSVEWGVVGVTGFVWLEGRGRVCWWRSGCWDGPRVWRRRGRRGHGRVSGCASGFRERRRGAG